MPISPPGRKIYPANFLPRIDDYTEDMATFTALAKIYSSEYFCNARVAGTIMWGLANFCPAKIFGHTVVYFNKISLDLLVYKTSILLLGLATGIRL